ncbi:hypothetical protein M0R45_008258 [Rubus argutus]|uniref:Uncharacterized protein n=1 Tax=Rubus argutus TaxID=59490 RepID=A0AAW1Y186_RUBAR
MPFVFSSFFFSILSTSTISIQDNITPSVSIKDGGSIGATIFKVDAVWFAKFFTHLIINRPCPHCNLFVLQNFRAALLAAFSSHWSIERRSLVQLLCPPKQSQFTTIPNSQFTITTQHITNHHLQSSQFTQATIKSITLFTIQHPDYHHHSLKSCPTLLAAAGTLTAQRTQTKAQSSGRNIRTQQSPPTPQLHLFLKSAAHELQQSPLNPILASPALSSHHHHHQPRSTTSAAAAVYPNRAQRVPAPST